MRKIVPIVVAVTMSITAGGAWAAPPVVSRPASFEVDISFPSACSFPLVAHVEGRTLALTFDGRGFSGGQLFVTWTRVGSDGSLRIAISGPTFYDALGNAVRGTGRWTTPMEGVGWVLATGNLTFDGTEDGFALITSMTGTSTSICELLG